MAQVGVSLKIPTDTVVEISVICKHTSSLAVTVICCTKEHAPHAVCITSLWKMFPLPLKNRTWRTSRLGDFSGSLFLTDNEQDVIKLLQ